MFEPPGNDKIPANYLFLRIKQADIEKWACEII